MSEPEQQLRAVEWKKVGRKVLVRCPHCTVMAEWDGERDGDVDFQCGTCRHTEKVRLEKRSG